MATFLPGVTDVFPGPAPFDPDFQFIDTMLRRRQSMYEQGYSQISNAYRALNRNLSNPQNADSRDKFLREAEYNLKDLSAMDLSMPQNVDAAYNVFKPFYQNTDILADMSLTSHWDKQESIADMYRTKDGGKEYSSDNINYVRMQRSKFAQDDPNNWRSYMLNKRSYTPYYDWNKEFAESMKNYKPDQISIKRRNGMYNILEENKGATAEDLKLYFSSIASNKAKEQMRIEAAVRIGDNAEAVAPIYKNVLERELNAYTQRLQDVDTEIKIASDKKTRDMLSSQKSLIEDEIRERKTNIEKIKSGDIEFLRSNASNIAFSIYFDGAISQLAKGMSWKDYKYDFDGDDVAMMYYKESQQWARERFKQDRADARARNKKEKKDKEEEEENDGYVGFVNLPSFGNQNTEQTTVSSIQAQMESNRKIQADQSRLLQKHVANILQKDPGSVTARDIMMYAKSPQGQIDETYFRYKQRINSLILNNDQLQASIFNAQNKAKEKVGEQTYNTIQGKLKKLDALGKDRNITGQEMYHGILDGTVRLVSENPTVVTGPFVSPVTQAANERVFLEINGQRYNLRDNKNLMQMYEAARNFASNPMTTTYNQTFKQGISEEGKVIGKGMIRSQTDKRYKFTAGSIGTIIGLDATKIGGIIYGGKNDVYFSLDSDKDWDTQKEEIAMKAASMGIELKIDDNTKQFYMKEIPGVSKVKLGADIYQGFTSEEQQLMNYGEQSARNGYVSPHFQPANKMKDKFGTPIKPFFYKVVEDNNEKIFYLYNDDLKGKFIYQSNNIADIFEYSKSIADNYTRYLQSVQATFGPDVVGR